MLTLSNVILISLSKSAEAVILIDICILTSLCAIGFIGYVFISRNYKTKLEVKSNSVAETCQNFITELLFEETLTPKGIIDQEYLLKNKFRKQLLLNEILKLHSSIQGAEAIKLETFYLNSELLKISDSKVHSSNKDLVLSGLSELVEMNAKTYIPKLKQLLYETFDNELKNYLLAAIVKLEPAKGLKLILHAEHYLTDWFHLVIIKALDEIKYTDFPPLAEWITKKGSIALFGERLYDFKNSLNKKNSFELAAEPVDSEVKETKNSLSRFEFTNIDQAIINIYENESAEVKEEIRNTLMLFNSKLVFPEPPQRNIKGKKIKDLVYTKVTTMLKNVFKPDKRISDLYLLWRNRAKPKDKK